MCVKINKTKLSFSGAVALAEFVAESTKLVRLDLRENSIKTGGLMALSLSLKVNQTVTCVDLDKEPKKESVSGTGRCCPSTASLDQLDFIPVLLSQTYLISTGLLTDVNFKYVTFCWCVLHGDMSTTEVVGLDFVCRQTFTAFFRLAFVGSASVASNSTLSLVLYKFCLIDCLIYLFGSGRWCLLITDYWLSLLMPTWFACLMLLLP